MNRNVSLAVGMGALLLLAGCGSQETQSRSESLEPESTATAVSQGHAAGIVPGSYEDWCAEHEVPETQCTQCDPSLVPAFQAANDWDPEHGLPMSHCRIHNPNLKLVRPPKPEGK